MIVTTKIDFRCMAWIALDCCAVTFLTLCPSSRNAIWKWCETFQMPPFLGFVTAGRGFRGVSAGAKMISSRRSGSSVAPSDTCVFISWWILLMTVSASSFLVLIISTALFVIVVYAVSKIQKAGLESLRSRLFNQRDT